MPHVRDRDDFPLRGWLLCPECGKPVTASISTGNLRNKYGFYRCHRAARHMNVRSQVVEDAFVDLLEHLTPKPERMELIERVFRDSWSARIQTAAVESTALRAQLAKAEARKRRVLEQMADGNLSPDDFATLNRSTVESIADLRQRLTLSESNVLDLDSAIEYLTHLLWNTSIVWQTSDL